MYIENLKSNQQPVTYYYFEAFAGIGAQALAMERLEKKLPIKFECVGISEVDPYASKGYEALNGKVRNYGDITSIDYETLPHFDVLHTTSPCPDVSMAGQRKGMKKDSGTRSSLAWTLIPLLKAKRKKGDLPMLILFENVKGIIQGDVKEDFDAFLKAIEEFGYYISWQCLDANDYESCQHRERIFVVCSLLPGYVFPKPREKKILFKDILDKDVDESFNYNSKNPIDRSLYRSNRTLRIYNPSYCERSSTLLRHGTGGTEDIYIFREDISSDPVVRVKLKFLEKNGIDINKVYSTKVRTITPNEAMKLMTFNSDEIARFNKARLSKTRVYALMGNSICVNVLEDILYEYFKQVLEMK